MLYQLYPVLIHLTSAVSAQKVKRIAKRASLVLLPSPPPFPTEHEPFKSTNWTTHFPHDLHLNHHPSFHPFCATLEALKKNPSIFMLPSVDIFVDFVLLCVLLSISLSLAPFLLRFFSFFSRKMQIEIHIAHTCRVEGVFVWVGSMIPPLFPLFCPSKNQRQEEEEQQEEEDAATAANNKNPYTWVVAVVIAVCLLLLV